MTNFSGFKSIIFMSVILTSFFAVSLHAEEYKWLKTSKYENIFVYTDFKGCEIVAKHLNETIKIILLRSELKPVISDSLVFQSYNEGGKPVIEFMNNKLIENNKIFLYVYGKCIEYGSVYIYQFDVSFAIFDNRYSQAVIYSVPKHNVIGAESINGMKKIFRKLIEEAAADYVSANKAKPK